jgi:hypothetical protein
MNMKRKSIIIHQAPLFPPPKPPSLPEAAAISDKEYPLVPLLNITMSSFEKNFSFKSQTIV